MPLRQVHELTLLWFEVHELTFLWFGLLGPLLIFMDLSFE